MNCEVCGAGRGHFLICPVYLAWVHRYNPKARPVRKIRETKTTTYAAEAAKVWAARKP